MTNFYLYTWYRTYLGWILTATSENSVCSSVRTYNKFSKIQIKTCLRLDTTGIVTVRGKNCSEGRPNSYSFTIILIEIYITSFSIKMGWVL